MSIETRLKKLEATSNTKAANACHCANAIALAATPFFEVCFRCGKAIDSYQWQHWQTFHPSAQANFFAFGLRRDDAHEFDGKQNEFFIVELFEGLGAEP